MNQPPQWMKGINPPMNDRNQPSKFPINEKNQPLNEWKESTLQWMKGINPPMNKKNHPSNKWKECILWMKGINLPMNESNQLSNGWKELPTRWRKGATPPIKGKESPFQLKKWINPLMNTRNQPSNEWKKMILQWVKENNPLMNLVGEFWFLGRTKNVGNTIFSKWIWAVFCFGYVKIYISQCLKIIFPILMGFRCWENR